MTPNQQIYIFRDVSTTSGPLQMQIKRNGKRKFAFERLSTDIHLNGDDTYDPRRGM